MICSSLFKTLLWVANFVIFAAGMFLIGAGIYVYKEMNQGRMDRVFSSLS